MAGRGISTLVVRNAEVEGGRVDVRIEGDVVSALGPAGTMAAADAVIDGAGGALLSGLHDHHLHLMSMAAAVRSVDVGVDLDAAIASAHQRTDAGEWVRAVGYDEAVHGSVDRWRLDALAPGRAVRLQHRSGAMWVLSSAAVVGLGALPSGIDGLERDAAGEPTGRLYRLDGWLRSRLPEDPAPDLGAIGRRLVSYGVTGVTDCTATDATGDFDVLAAAVRAGDLPITVMTTGGVALAEVTPPDPLRRGPVKVVLSDHDLPSLADVAGWFHHAHRAGRPVALHCVTRAALVLALAAWGDVGAVPGDRIEHGSVVPIELTTLIAELGIAIVTQPAFIAARGDMYLRDVDPLDRGDLYRCASLIAAGIEVGGSTDAPFGPDDPWIAMTAAVHRRTESGATVGSGEALSSGAALALFLAPLEHPGGPARPVAVGARADLCLLGSPLANVLADPSSRHVRATISGGQVVHQA